MTVAVQSDGTRRTHHESITTARVAYLKIDAVRRSRSALHVRGRLGLPDGLKGDLASLQQVLRPRGHLDDNLGGVHADLEVPWKNPCHNAVQLLRVYLS